MQLLQHGMQELPRIRQAQSRGRSSEPGVSCVNGWVAQQRDRSLDLAQAPVGLTNLGKPSV